MPFKLKKSKYSNRKVNGYDSAKESRRAAHLSYLQKAGQISELKEQVAFVLCQPQYGHSFEGKEIVLRREMRYVADFVYIEKGLTVVEDVKGYKTAEYKRKKRLMKLVHGITILET
jgi:hypothetical protein